MMPTPNDYGVYDKADAETISFESGDRACAEINVLEIEPGVWVTGYDCQLRWCGCGGPIMAHGQQSATRQAAVDLEMARMVGYLKAKDQDYDAQATVAEAHDLLRQINEYQNQGRLFL